MQPTRERIVLLGAGLAGPLLAIFLARRGFQVEVYERRPDPRTTAQNASRSINLALSTRGIHALQQVGLDHEVLRQAIPMRGRMIHAPDGELRFQPYGQNESEVLYAVSRAGLNTTLLHAAERSPHVHLAFNQQCRGLQLPTGTLELYNTATGTVRSISPTRVIGTDGSVSAVRTSMLSLGRFDFSQQYLEHGYKELTIPPAPDGSWRLDQNALHIWPRGSYMLIALPNADGSFTGTLFLPFEGADSFASLTTADRVLAFFRRQFPDAVPLMPRLAEDFLRHPTGSLVTIKCFPWYLEDRVLLLGDAAHAIVPFYGQGMNCAFEDCTCVAACIDQHYPDWQRIFTAFEQARKENTDAIAEMAMAHYLEMRHHVADPKFLLHKQVELALERRYPGVFIPQYSMVTFHRIPYAVARRRGALQAKLLEELCARIEHVDELDWEQADRLITHYLQAS